MGRKQIYTKEGENIQTRWIARYKKHPRGDHNFARLAIADYRHRYPNNTTFASNLSKLKRKLIELDKHRHPSFLASLKQLKAEFPEEEKEIKKFESMTMRDQNKIIITCLKKANPNNYENALAKIIVLPDEISKLKPPMEVIKDIVEKTNKSLDRKVNNVITIDNPDEFVKRLLSGITSNKPQSFIVALILACGRRINEVLSPTTNFEPVQGNDYEAVFSGASKIGLKLTSDKFKIPLLVNFNLFKNAWDLLQSNKKSKTTVARYVKKSVGNYPITVHGLRSLYACVCVQLFKPDNQTINSYIGQILGHGESVSSLHYLSIQAKIKNLPEISDSKQ